MRSPNVPTIRLALVVVYLVVLVCSCDRVDETRPSTLPDVAEPPGRCPSTGVRDIVAGGDPQQMRTDFRSAVATEGMTVRLGPGVDLDFSEDDLTSRELFPIYVTRCVTITSTSQGPAPQPTGDPNDVHGDIGGGVLSDGSDDPVPVPTEGRTPSSPGPTLRLGPHSGEVSVFMEIRCEPDGSFKGDGVRISGFRVIGPTTEDQDKGEIGIRINECVDVEISNMEVAGWGTAAIGVLNSDVELDNPEEQIGRGRISQPQQVRIHDNYLYGNQHSSSGGGAAGYGVLVSHGAWAHIYRNVFDLNRHAIAASGDAGGYIAENNLVLKGGGWHDGWFNPYTHSFDFHGTGCWWSGDLCGNAGVTFSILGNAFQYRKDNAIKIRGRPTRLSVISGNVFPHPGIEDDEGDDAINLDTTDNVQLGPNNVHSYDSFGNYKVCDFDADGIDDLFLGTGVNWWFSSYGEYQWTYLNAKPERTEDVRLGYFDGDLRCDVLAERDGQWMISSGGTAEWASLGDFGTSLSTVEFGRFHATRHDERPGATRHTTHAFRREADGQWSVTELTGPNWEQVASSGKPMDELRFGDFTGDGETDVLSVDGGRWAISKSARGPWTRINDTLGDPVKNLFIANMDPDDNIDDIFRIERHTTGSETFARSTFTILRSRNGTGPWEGWKSYTFEYLTGTQSFFPGQVFAGRFGVAPGGATLIIGSDRRGHFYSPAEALRGRQPEWDSIFWY